MGTMNSNSDLAYRHWTSYAVVGATLSAVLLVTSYLACLLDDDEVMRGRPADPDPEFIRSY
jgi:hypothetical protein